MRFHEKLSLVLLHASIYIFSFKKMPGKVFNIPVLKIILVLELCPRKTKSIHIPVRCLKEIEESFQIWRTESFLVITIRKHRKVSENQEQCHSSSEPLKTAQYIFSWIKTMLEAWFSLAHKVT